MAHVGHSTDIVMIPSSEAGKSVNPIFGARNTNEHIKRINGTNIERRRDFLLCKNVLRRL